MRHAPARQLLAAIAALLVAASAAQAAPLQDMLDFDAIYIPALSDTTNGGKSAEAQARAVASMDRLRQQWPTLRARLAAVWPGDPRWRRNLDKVERHVAQAQAAVVLQDWKAAHESLEHVRLVLMAARQARGMDYFVDRLTRYHEPMEVLALAGSTLKPEQVDEPTKQRLSQAFAQARAQWLRVEREPIEQAAAGLPAARAAQLRQGLAEESAALSRLSLALAGDDAAQLLRSAAAIKPPFARSFTAFGLAAGETPRNP